MSTDSDRQGATDTDRQDGTPRCTVGEAATLVRELFGISGQLEPLDSYIDQNFRVTEASGTQWVFKLTNAHESEAELAFQHRVMDRLHERAPGIAPHVRRSLAGSDFERHEHRGQRHLARVVNYLPGSLLSSSRKRDAETWRSFGKILAQVDRALADLDHPAMKRELRWDLAQAEWTLGRTADIEDLSRRALLERAQVQFRADVMRRFDRLPQQVIYNDANDNNVVVADSEGAARISGVFDFGDAIHTARIFELAVAGSYAVFDQSDPLDVLTELVAGYHQICPLERLELGCLLASVQMRLVASVLVSNQDAVAAPDNDYIRVSEAPAWAALERLALLDPTVVEDRLLTTCGYEAAAPVSPATTIRERRERHVGSALSVSYRKPLHLVKGRMQYLFDATGRAYLDGVNNICHVGHCHPRVVESACRQIETLNTNTRYYHQHIADYAERLAALFPNPLEVCYFVNSGSEANELALRMARAHTNRQAVLSLGAGYHGNTTTLIDISSYKHEGPGGGGAPDWVYTVPCPDAVRGEHRGPDAADRYLDTVTAALAKADHEARPVAAFIAEPIIGCGGQVVPPEGYLRRAFDLTRIAGAVTIADEVQVGFGRTGPHYWAYRAQDATPDIVTLGKPMGNGHPLAAVITSRAIADSFDNGMEYFSSFGGNPVSCAIGLAVLDIIEDESLATHAEAMGALLLEGFHRLRQHHPAITDIRGAGLYLGIELSKPNGQPAPDLAAQSLENARDTGVLLSSDGPNRNVLKIKPPLAIQPADAQLLLTVLDRALTQATQTSLAAQPNLR